MNTQSYLFSTIAPASVPGLSERIPEVVKEERECPKNAADILRKWGCSESDIKKIFFRQPSLCNANGSDLDSKLKFLNELGLGSSDLVKMVNCRPRFLCCRLNRYFDDARIEELRCLFGSTELFLKAVVRNPSLLMYDFHKTVKPVISLYERMGISRDDLISMIMLRPTLISRTNMSEEKLEYIRRTKVSKGSKMYKYVVTIIGVSRFETIREKTANLERFGFTEDEVLEIFGRSPLLMTLSLDKVQRNMTFLLGTMKLPAKTICAYPFLLYSSLEDLLKPRVLVAKKIQDLGLCPQIEGPFLFRALRMTEQRFLKAFVLCHEDDTKYELLDYYRTAKRMKRLALSSRRNSFANGFPF